MHNNQYIFSCYPAIILNIHHNFKSFSALLKNKPSAVYLPFHLKFYWKVQNLSFCHFQYASHPPLVSKFCFYPFSTSSFVTEVSIGLTVQPGCFKLFLTSHSVFRNETRCLNTVAYLISSEYKANCLTLICLSLVLQKELYSCCIVLIRSYQPA